MLKIILTIFISFIPIVLQAAGNKGFVKNTDNNVVMDEKGASLSVDLNQTFLLEVNQKAVVKGEDLTILAVEVFDDLCKDGLNCEEGTMSIRLVITKGNEKKDILLSVKDGRKPIKPVIVEVLGYKIQLIEMGESAAMLVVRK